MGDALGNVRQALQHALAGHQELEKASRILAGGPADYYFAKLNEYVTALFDRFAPFRPGDRVQLNAAPDTNNNWRSSAHFLIVGALGEVVEVDYSVGRFVFGVVFDKESWIDQHGQEHAAENRHVYRISETILTREGNAMRRGDSGGKQG